MNELTVSIEINGVLISAGKIRGNGPSDACFQYSEEYCEKKGAPVSISLPLQKEAFSPGQTAAFF
ncbi:MAG: HipA N-terminal domain-containing protein [Oscillospiraceae bacterium]|nr:HipA N-terminal domain-containing protein [Oscillospiraceae bacterium]